MDERNYNEIAKELVMALVDDFRGFLIEGTERVEVPDDKLHIQIALEELMKIPGWKHESGVGEVPTVELMKDKNAIYITKIPIPGEKGKYQRSVGYITDMYNDEIVYKGKHQKAYEVLRKIAIGMGYDVDEYELLKRTEETVKTPVMVTNYRGNLKIKKSRVDIKPQHSIKDGDKPQFDKNGEFIGFISGGKFISKAHYARYSSGLKKAVANPGESKKDMKMIYSGTKNQDNGEQGDR